MIVMDESLRTMVNLHSKTPLSYLNWNLSKCSPIPYQEACQRLQYYILKPFKCPMLSWNVGDLLRYVMHWCFETLARTDRWKTLWIQCENHMATLLLKNKIFLIAIHHSMRKSEFRCIMTSSNGNIFHATGPLCEEFTGHRWIPRTKAGDAAPWRFLWSAPVCVSNGDAGDLRSHRFHYNVTVMRECVLHKMLLWQFLSGFYSTERTEILISKQLVCACGEMRSKKNTRVTQHHGLSR